MRCLALYSTVFIVSAAIASPVPVPTNSIPSVTITSPRGTESSLTVLGPALNIPPQSATWSQLLTDRKPEDGQTQIIHQSPLQSAKQRIRVRKIKQRSNHMSPEPINRSDEKESWKTADLRLPNIYSPSPSRKEGMDPKLKPTRPTKLFSIDEDGLQYKAPHKGGLGSQKKVYHYDTPRITVVEPDEEPLSGARKTSLKAGIPRERSVIHSKPSSDEEETQLMPQKARKALKDGEIRMDDGSVFPFIAIVGLLKDHLPGHREANEQVRAELARRKRLKQEIKKVYPGPPTPFENLEARSPSKWKPLIKTIPEEEELAESGSTVRHGARSPLSPSGQLSRNTPSLEVDTSKIVPKNGLRHDLKGLLSPSQISIVGVGGRAPFQSPRGVTSELDKAKSAYSSPSRTKFDPLPIPKNVQNAGNRISTLHGLIPSAFNSLNIEDDQGESDIYGSKANVEYKGGDIAGLVKAKQLIEQTSGGANRKLYVPGSRSKVSLASLRDLDAVTRASKNQTIKNEASIDHVYNSIDGKTLPAYFNKFVHGKNFGVKKGDTGNEAEAEQY